MAGDEGFEPPMSEPESDALPLGQSPLQDLNNYMDFGYRCRGLAICDAYHNCWVFNSTAGELIVVYNMT